MGTLQLETAVQGVLLLRFLTGASDDQICLSERPLLSVDAGTHGIGTFHLQQVAPGSQKSPLLFATEGMTCENEGDAQPLADQGTHKAGIGVMSVNPVDHLTGLTQMIDKPINQLHQMRPEPFLSQVSIWTETETQNAGPGSDGFLRNGIVTRNLGVLDQPGDHIDLIDIRLPRQMLDKLEDVQGLPACVGITPKLQLMGTEQAMQVQMQQTQTHSWHQQTAKAWEGFFFV